MGLAHKDFHSNAETEDGTTLAQEFRTLALRYVEIGFQEGVRVIPFLSPEMPLFAKATAEERQKATDSLRTIVGIHEETLSSGTGALNSQQLIWRALTKFNLIPEPEVFTKFKSEDIVLVYDDQQTLVFWNLQFFKYVSLSVEQLFLDKWYLFTKRDPAVQEKIAQMASNAFSGKYSGTFEINIPGHEVEEVGTLENVKSWMEILWGSILKRNKNFGGLLIVQRMRLR